MNLAWKWLVRPSHTGFKTGCRPPTTKIVGDHQRPPATIGKKKCSHHTYFWSAISHMTGGPQSAGKRSALIVRLHAPNTSLWPVGHREVLCSLLSVGECHTMVFNSWCKVSMVFSSRWSLIVHDQSATSCRPRLSASRRSVGDNLYKWEGSQGQSSTGHRWVVIYVRWSATVVW